MVDRLRCYAHREVLPDFIEFAINPCLVNRDALVRAYVKDGLTSAQTAEKLGVSKQFVLKKLRSLGIRGATGKGRDPGNYRFKNPPYGCRVVDGKLETLKSELKIVRMIVEKREREGLSFERIAIDLNLKNHRTRNGAEWNRSYVGVVYRRWRGKM